MSDITAKWGTKTAVPLTGTSLADAAARQSDAVTSHNGMGALVRVSTKAAGANTGKVAVYVYSSLGDTTYTGGASGSDAAYTAAQWGSLEKLGDIVLDGTTPVHDMFSIGEKFAGVVPSRWGIILHNQSGGALSGTAGDHVVEYQTVIATQV